MRHSRKECRKWDRIGWMSRSIEPKQTVTKSFFNCNVVILNVLSGSLFWKNFVFLFLFLNHYFLKIFCVQSVCVLFLFCACFVSFMIHHFCLICLFFSISFYCCLYFSITPFLLLCFLFYFIFELVFNINLLLSWYISVQFNDFIHREKDDQRHRNQHRQQFWPLYVPVGWPRLQQQLRLPGGRSTQCVRQSRPHTQRQKRRPYRGRH